MTTSVMGEISSLAASSHFPMTAAESFSPSSSASTPRPLRGTGATEPYPTLTCLALPPSSLSSTPTDATAISMEGRVPNLSHAAYESGVKGVNRMRTRISPGARAVDPGP